MFIHREITVKSNFTTNQSGFTLVELMLSLILTSSIAGLLASSWWLIIRFDTRASELCQFTPQLEDRIRLGRFVHSVFSDTTNLTGKDFELITNETCSTATMWISPGAFSVPDKLTDRCRLKVVSGSFPGVQLTIQCPSINDICENSKPVLSETFLVQNRSTRIEVLGLDNQWHNQWTKPEHHGLPRAIKFSSLPLSGNIRSCNLSVSDVIMPLPCANSFYLSDGDLP